MSSYHSGFRFLGKDSRDEGWIIASFDPDNGEMDSGLSQEQIYTDSYRGTKRLLYGTKYDSVLTIKITVVKCNGSDFSLSECRKAYRWLTGNPTADWLNLYVGDVLQYEFLGTIQDVKPYKMDARTVGLVIYFESLSPWAYSPIQITEPCIFNQVLSVDSDGVVYSESDDNALKINDTDALDHHTEEFSVLSNGTLYIDNSSTVIIDNETDDLYTDIYLDTVFTNINSDYLSIKNITTGDETIITNMSEKEIITLSASQFIISDLPGKIFGNNFNFVWPRLIPGVNEFVIYGSGSGSVQFTYRYPIKIGDCAMDVNMAIEESNCGGGDTCYVDENELQAMLNRVLV